MNGTFSSNDIADIESQLCIGYSAGFKDRYIQSLVVLKSGVRTILYNKSGSLEYSVLRPYVEIPNPPAK